MDFIQRILDYSRRHGFRATIDRAWLACRRLPRGKQLVLFYCDLTRLPATPIDHVAPGRVDRICEESRLNAQDLAQIAEIGYAKGIRRQLSERFARGASLWLFKSQETLMGYGWTISGNTMAPHFYPLGRDDVHLFDFFVMPQYRGLGINISLVNHVLTALASEGKSRAFIEAAEWNRAQLRSLSRMPFNMLGQASKCRVLGKTIVVWTSGHQQNS
jgi:GNAT superfamily N-acetyltransferase